MTKLQMKQLWMFGIALFLTMNAMSENLINNGSFKAAQTTVPEFWNLTENVVCNRSAGPNGQASIAFVAGDGASTVRQLGLILIEGEKYKLSGWYKATNFKAKAIKVVIHNTGWTNDSGALKFQTNTAWTSFEKEFIAFKSKNSKYGVAIYGKDIQGEIQFADLKLEPFDLSLSQ